MGWGSLVRGGGWPPPPPGPAAAGIGLAVADASAIAGLGVLGVVVAGGAYTMSVTDVDEMAWWRDFINDLLSVNDDEPEIEIIDDEDTPGTDGASVDVPTGTTRSVNWAEPLPHIAADDLEPFDGPADENGNPTEGPPQGLKDWSDKYGGSIKWNGREWEWRPPEPGSFKIPGTTKWARGGGSSLNSVGLGWLDALLNGLHEAGSGGLNWSQWWGTGGNGSGGFWVDSSPGAGDSGSAGGDDDGENGGVTVRLMSEQEQRDWQAEKLERGLGGHSNGQNRFVAIAMTDLVDELVSGGWVGNVVRLRPR